MKKETTNLFNQGMNLDLHPMVTPNSVLTDNLNGTFITYNGNEFCLQNDKGNFKVAHLSEGYVPIGAKEYNGIIYIVSVKNAYENPDEPDEEKRIIKVEDCVTEIGTYPGVNWGNTPYEKEFDLLLPEKVDPETNCYTPLGNIDVQETVNDDGEIIDIQRGSFSNLKLGYTTQTPVTIEIQPSYDGSVNLILTDGKNPVRMINSGFSVLPENKYKLIKRNQSYATNNYNSDKLDELGLIRTTNIITNIDLEGVQPGGQFKGGNYTFYLKFGDSDYNQTDVVAESGIISIFKGNDCIPSTISGTVLDERTDKMIGLKITGLNRIYSKLYLYYSREYSDTLGYRLTEYGVFKEPINIKPDENSDSQVIWLTGYEQTEVINSEEIKIDYHTFDSARAEAQQQNMLFLGNLKNEETYELYKNLDALSKAIKVTAKQELTLPQTSFLYNTDTGSNSTNSEYYSVENIYNNVGYWPGEIYRFGVVYILKDGSTTPVFNMYGDDGNKYGIFKVPDYSVFTSTSIKPISFEFIMHENINSYSDKVIGYFYVRQKRIPITLCQGLRLGVDSRTHLPVTWNGKHWLTQSFLSLNRDLYFNATDRTQEIDKWKVVVTNKQSWDTAIPTLEYNNSGILAQSSTKTIVTVNKVGVYEGQYLTYTNEDAFIHDNLDNYFLETGTIWGTEDDPINTYAYNIVLKYDSNFNSTENISVYFVTNKDISQIDNYLHLGNPFNYDIYWDTTDEAAISGAREKQEVVAEAVIRESQKGFIDKYIPYPNRYDSQINSALLTLDPCVNANVRNILDGSEFVINEEYSTSTYFGDTINTPTSLRGTNPNYNLLQIQDRISSKENIINDTSKCVYISPETKIKEIDSIGFSNVAGDASDISRYSYPLWALGLRYNGKDTSGNSYTTYWNLKESFNGIEEKTLKNKNVTDIGFNTVLNVNIVRGLFTPYVGITGNLSKHGIYSIQLKQPDNIKDSYLIRQQDESSYYTISKRFSINDNLDNVIYRGDCFTNTVSIRILRNFIDSDVPVSDNIVKHDAWHWYIRAYGDNEGNNNQDADRKIKPPDNLDWSEVNRADVNTVDLGYWVTFKCLSSYNLGLRSEDSFHEQELSLLGSPRSFFPINSGSTATGNKMEESFLLNDGYSATVGEKTYDLLPDVPYTKSEFANRIIFSNVQVDDSYINGYRMFQGLSYKDYDKQYGAIVKLVSWDNNLIVIMEHGIGVVGVNEQALMQTSTADTIHIYGHGVLSDHMQIISPDFGSKYEHSVIRTPLGVYGIDTDARKIWRFSTQKGFETLSDMKIESYLNDNMFTNEKVEMEICDVRTHYNETKGDIMFTFFKRKLTKKSVEPKMNNDRPINDSQINLNPGETVERYFPIDSDTQIISIGPAIVERTDDGVKFIAPENTYGTGTTVIIDKDGKQTDIEYNIKSPTEINKEKQEEIKEQTKESLDDLTIKIVDAGNNEIKEGESKPYTVKLNKTSIGLCDLIVDYDPKMIKYELTSKGIYITAINSGTTSIQLNYGNKKSNIVWITIIKKRLVISTSENNTLRYLNDVDEIRERLVGEYTSLSFREVTGKMNISISDPNKLEYTIVDNSIILHTLSIGNPVVTIQDDRRTVKITVPIINDIPLTDVTWVTEGTCSDPGFIGTNANIIMHVGESIKYHYRDVPANHTSGYTSFKIKSDSIGYLVAASVPGSIMKPSCNGTYSYDPGVEIMAKKAGKGTVELILWNKAGQKIKIYTFNVTIK